MKAIRWIWVILFLTNNLSAVFSQSPLWYLTKGLSGKIDESWAVDVDSIGNIYWATAQKDVWPHWYFNILLVKIDSNAQQIWQSPSWGNGTGFNDIAFIAKASGQEIYLAGRLDSTAALDGSGGNALVLSFNASNGNFNWDYVYDQGIGYEEIDGLLVQPDGIYITGWTQSPETDTISSTMNIDFLVQKINFSGQQVWSSIYDYNNLGRFDGENGHSAMDNNFIYAAGHVNRSNYLSLDGDMGLVCFSRTNGAYQWNVTWGGISFDDGLGMTMSSDSMLYIAGYTGSFGNGSQVYLNKFSRTGQLQWSRLWGGTGAEVSRALVTDGDSIIYEVGTTASYGNGTDDIFILKYNSAGILLDSLVWGGAYREVAHDVAMYGEYLYITGTTESFGNGPSDGYKSDALLLKINGRTMQTPDTTMTFVNEVGQTNSEISVFPNPFSTQTMLQATSLLKNATITVYNYYGQTVKEIKNIRGQTIVFSRENLASGLYFIRLTQDHKIVMANKLAIID